MLRQRDYCLSIYIRERPGERDEEGTCQACALQPETTRVITVCVQACRIDTMFLVSLPVE